MLLVPCGGGGLLSGSAIAARNSVAKCRVIGIEPELADDATRSFQSGRLQTVKNPPTIADGTRTPSLGEQVTFPLVLKYVDDMQTVTEAAIIEAVKFLPGWFLQDRIQQSRRRMLWWQPAWWPAHRLA